MSKRYEAFKAQCPKCGAPPYSKCLGKRGKRKAVHIERMSAEALFEGVVTAPACGFYASREWMKARYEALRINGAACQCCGTRPAPGRPLHVDHIKPRSRYPELALSVSNLQVLCEACNLGKGASDQTDWRAK